MKTHNIELISLVNKIATDNNLTVKKRELMKNLALGLDEEQRKLLIVQKVSEDRCDWRIIRFDNIRNHFIKKTYRKIESSDSKTGILNEYLEKVTLHLEFYNCKQHFEIVFYDHNDHNIFELSQLVQSARDWDVIFYKMRKRQTHHSNTFITYKSQYWQGY